MHTKKILSIACATLLSASIIGCGTAPKQPENTSEPFYSATDTTVSYVYIDEDTDALLTKIDDSINDNAKAIKESDDPASVITDIINDVVKDAGQAVTVEAVGYDVDAGYAYYTINGVLAGTSLN